MENNDNKVKEHVDRAWDSLNDEGKQTIGNVLGFLAALEKSQREYDYNDW